MRCWMVWGENRVHHISQVFYLSPRMIHECQYIVRCNLIGEESRIHHDLIQKMNLRVNPMFVGTVDNQIQGFIMGHRTDRDGCIDPWGNCSWIDWLFVAPEFQSRGIGGALIAMYQSYCLQMDIFQIFLRSADTVRARHFYIDLHKFEVVDGFNMILTKKLMSDNHR